MDIQSRLLSTSLFLAKLYRLAKMMLNDTDEAKDVVQEVLLKLWTRRDTLGNYRSIEALAMIITKNLCLDKLKSHIAKRRGEWMVRKRIQIRVHLIKQRSFQTV